MNLYLRSALLWLLYDTFPWKKVVVLGLLFIVFFGDIGDRLDGLVNSPFFGAEVAVRSAGCAHDSVILERQLKVTQLKCALQCT